MHSVFAPADWIHLYRKAATIASRLGLGDVGSQPHPLTDCSLQNCTFAEVKSTFVCVASGNLHVCDGDCSLRHTMRDAQVCPISGVAYAPDFDASTDQFTTRLSEHKETMRRMRTGKKRLRPVDLAPKPPMKRRLSADEEEMEIYRVLQRLLGSGLRMQLNEKKSQNFSKHIHYSISKYILQQRQKKQPSFFEFIFSMYMTENQKRSDLDELKYDLDAQDIERLCCTYTKEVRRWWVIIRPYVADLESYKLVSHTLAVLYTLRDGVAPRLPPDPVLEHVLPPLNTLRTFRFRSRAFTRHQHVFLKALQAYWADPAPIVHHTHRSVPSLRRNA
jgi:hypothetical protein